MLWLVYTDLNTVWKEIASLRKEARECGKQTKKIPSIALTQTTSCCHLTTNIAQENAGRASLRLHQKYISKIHWHSRHSQTLFRLPVPIKKMNLHHLFLLRKECHIPQQEKIFHTIGIVMTDSWTVSSEHKEEI